MKNVKILLLVIVMAAGVRAATPGGSTPTPKVLDNVLFEDFENPSGWNGANPATGWTVIDNGQADGAWDSYDWSKYSAWGGGTARVSGASANRYNNDWLISPAVDFSSSTACTLSYRHYYDDYLTQDADSALVLLSNDNGSTWGDTVMVYAGADYGSDSVPDSEYFNISSFAAGYSQVVVAFQYVKRQAVVTGSWRIDDVNLRADGASLLIQNFDSGWGPYGDNPPANWTLLDIHVVKWDDNDWHQANVANWGNIADVFWSPIEQQNEFLISPVVDLSVGTIDIHLTLKQWYDDQAGNTDTAFILGSINGGSTWPETLAVYAGSDRGSLSTPAYDTLEMTNWANYESNIKIGFKYVGNNNGRWYIDSVGVDRIDMYTNDVKVDSITKPPEVTITGYYWPISAVVQNVGVYTNTFEVVYQIFDSTEALVYADSQSVTGLTSLERRTINFNPWHAAESNSHSIKCFTRMFIDLDHANDTLLANTMTYPHIGHAGPAEGWSYNDNITGDGPLFNWVDIRSIGTEINFSDPDNANSGMIDMGINFSYFGQTYSRIAVSTDGWLSFEDSLGIDHTPSAIPDPDGPQAMIALLWNDLHLRTGHAYYHQDPVLYRFIVQFDSVEYADIPGSDIGMEIIFDAPANSIKMQYSYFADGSNSDVSIGLENQAQDIGLSYSNGEIGQSPQPGLAITYTYLPPHDVKALAIDQPVDLVRNGGNFDIVARIQNVGANSESFEVTASDNHGFSNTQIVSDLASLATDTVTFSDWPISSECETYALRVFCNLGEDSNRSNDTVQTQIYAIAAANLSYIYDDGVILARVISNDTTDVIAAKFNSAYENATLSAISYKFLNQDELPYPTGLDSAKACIFIDADNDGLPDAQPIYSHRLEVAKTGWTIWDIGCDTNLVINCKNIWAGYSIIDSPYAAIGVDRNLEFPDNKWVREYGQWHLLGDAYGDYMIRAYVLADTSTQPQLALATRNIIGAAAPEKIDTVASYIENIGTGCELGYHVTINQTNQRILDEPTPDIPVITRENGQIDIINIHDPSYGNNSPDLPRTLANGGPDNYGYTWVDSNDPRGPLYRWIDISAIGTPVTWSNGDNDDGFTNPIPMGMTFNYYGANYDSVVISSNGWISFRPVIDDGFAHSSNAGIPAPGEFNTLLAVEWDNLIAGVGGNCYLYHDTAAGVFIISWLNWAHVPGQTDTHNFQAILDATRGTILYQYGLGTYPSDMTVGIQNSDGADGLQVIYNQPYLTQDLAVLFEPPIFWLSTDLANGILPAGSGQFPFKVFMNASGLPGGAYNGSIIISSTDIQEPVAVINVQFEIEGVCSYVVGDVNGSGAGNGVDVTFMVSYFKGGNTPHEECPPCAESGRQHALSSG